MTLEIKGFGTWCIIVGIGLFVVSSCFLDHEHNKRLDALEHEQKVLQSSGVVINGMFYEIFNEGTNK